MTYGIDNREEDKNDMYDGQNNIFKFSNSLANLLS